MLVTIMMIVSCSGVLCFRLGLEMGIMIVDLMMVHYIAVLDV